MTARTDIVICEPLRTPVGRMGGALAQFTATELATVALKELVRRTGLGEGDVASITAPTLAIAGADDPATPPDKLEEIAAGLPDARLLVVPRAAHLANAERPEIITPVLIEHLEKS